MYFETFSEYSGMTLKTFENQTKTLERPKNSIFELYLQLYQPKTSLNPNPTMDFPLPPLLSPPTANRLFFTSSAQGGRGRRVDRQVAELETTQGAFGAKSVLSGEAHAHRKKTPGKALCYPVVRFFKKLLGKITRKTHRKITGKMRVISGFLSIEVT